MTVTDLAMMLRPHERAAIITILETARHEARGEHLTAMDEARLDSDFVVAIRSFQCNISPR